MCLSVPAKIVSIAGTTATVDVAGNTREADITMIEDARVGEYVLLHAGFAIGRYSEADALKTLALWREMGEAREEDLGPRGAPRDGSADGKGTG
ncbi:MAG: HypC/HybG/HupF family hydrogenase formation chaperone [Planctomycetota bacterium]|jgi:hydrogenase expression/formation protein HypC